MHRDQYVYTLLLTASALATSCFEFSFKTRDTDSAKPNDIDIDSDSDIRLDGGDRTIATERDTGGDSASDIETETDSLPKAASCADMYCNGPTRTTCSTARSVFRFSVSGYCVTEDNAPRCKYAGYVDPCLVGSCVDGSCPEVPAQGTFCIDPPPLHCDGNDLVAYAARGIAEPQDRTVSCVYPKKTIYCENGCENDRCIGAPCEGVTCHTPPARYCDEKVLVLWDRNGRCNTRGMCDYIKQEITCENGCVNGACNQEHPCRYIDCADPPANFCLNADTLYTYTDQGYCEDGACIYLGAEVHCPCVDGRCEDDPCVGVACVHPPPTSCTADGRLRIWDGDPWGRSCQDGICVYDFVDIDCDKGDCVDGQCPDFCEGRNFYCNLPPPPSYCIDELTLLSYDSLGTCRGSGYCEWEPTVNRCATRCEAGACI